MGNGKRCLCTRPPRGVIAPIVRAVVVGVAVVFAGVGHLLGGDR